MKARLGDAEVLGDPADRRLTLAGDRDDVITATLEGMPWA